MKGYEGRYDCKRDTQEEGADEHPEKITHREEQSQGVGAVLAVGDDGTERHIYTIKHDN